MMLSPVLAPFAPKRKGGHCAGWPPPGALGYHGLHHGHLVRYPALISPPPAACGVAQKGAQRGPSSSTQTQDPREGPSLAGRTTRSFLRHGLIRLAREEAERSRWGTSRGARDASHDDQGRQAGASPRSVLLSSLVQREQAQARASRKGTRFGATRPRPVQRQGGSHCGAQASVTTRAFGRRGPTLVRISVLDVPLQNGQLLAPFPLNIWEEAQGLCL